MRLSSYRGRVASSLDYLTGSCPEEVRFAGEGAGYSLQMLPTSVNWRSSPLAALRARLGTTHLLSWFYRLGCDISDRSDKSPVPPTFGRLCRFCRSIVLVHTGVVEVLCQMLTSWGILAVVPLVYLLNRRPAHLQEVSLTAVFWKVPARRIRE